MGHSRLGLRAHSTQAKGCVPTYIFIGVVQRFDKVGDRRFGVWPYLSQYTGSGSTHMLILLLQHVDQMGDCRSSDLHKGMGCGKAVPILQCFDQMRDSRLGTWTDLPQCFPGDLTHVPIGVLHHFDQVGHARRLSGLP